MTGITDAMPSMGPLRVSEDNPRYFATPDGTPVLLTGSHTWSNLRDIGPADPPEPFDYPGYLAMMTAWGHNFMRMWAWDLFRFTHGQQGAESSVWYSEPMPWLRTGPGAALDGKPRFDLQRLDPAYFERLRSRVQLAREHRIYVSVMLFEGWGIQIPDSPACWEGHPFNVHNNINGVNGDPDGDGRGLETQTMQLPDVLAIQEAYVRRVMDTVNDFDNVLYEIANEAGPYSTAWQHHMIRFVQECERTKAHQHPVGMTFQYRGGSNRTLFDSPAQWISPNPEGGYTDNPPPADGSKVVISDTDHLWGIGGSHVWVWKSVCRGLNPIFMDPFTRLFLPLSADQPAWEPLRRAMGVARGLTERMDLRCALPSQALASSGYCLADPGREYLVYLPEGGEVTVDLAGAGGAFAVEWIHPTAGETTAAAPVSGGAPVVLRSPSDGDAVVFIRLVQTP